MQSYWSAIGGRIAFAAIIVIAPIAAGVSTRSVGLSLSTPIAVLAGFVVFLAIYWTRSEQRRLLRGRVSAQSSSKWLGDVKFAPDDQSEKEYALTVGPDAMELWSSDDPRTPSISFPRGQLVRAKDESLGSYALAGRLSIERNNGESPLVLDLLGPFWGEYPTPPSMLSRVVRELNGWI